MPYTSYQFSPCTDGVALHSPSVIIVEDEPLIAMAMEEEFLAAKYNVVGVFASCVGALAWLEAHQPDVAVLDVMLHDGPCNPLALELKRRGVPFLICSGVLRDENEPPELAHVPRLSKPMSFRQLVLATQALVFEPIIPGTRSRQNVAEPPRPFA